MNYLATILVVIILIILYYFYYYITNNELTSGLQNLKNESVVKYNKLKNPNSTTYSYQFWLYISEATTKSTPIFARKDDKPDFSVDISGRELSLMVGNGSEAQKKVMTIMPDLPIQKWTYVVVNVFNLRTYEAFINGKLAKTVNVTNSISPTRYTNNLYIGNPGLVGYVTKFTRTEKTVDAKKVWENYLNGNGLSNLFSSIIPYGLNISISKGEEIQRSISII